ncbi:hypothetical protein BGX38DRAFT_1144975 [Terfezia claveryi]|nr:hypothetical protein BGX38DRAFT_1144975 [Terfezia claveryi]
MFSASAARSARQSQYLLRPALRSGQLTRIAPARRPAGRRFQSTTIRDWASDATQSPLVAGFAGGFVALAGVYIWYHVSGTAKVMKTLRSTAETVERMKETVKEKLSEAPASNQALKYIRNAARSYANLLPGEAKEKMDSAFDQLEDFASGPRAEEVQNLVNETYAEVRKIFNEGGFDAHTAEMLKDVLEDKGKKLRRLVGDVGQQLLDKTPGLQDALKRSGAGNALSDITKIAKETGPEATKVVQDMYRELEQLLEGQSLTGAATDPTTIYKAVTIIQNKSDQVRRLGQKATEQAWNEAYGDLLSNKDGLLDLLPGNVRDFMKENAEGLKRAALQTGSVGGVYEVIGIIRRNAQNGEEGAKKIKDYVGDKVKQVSSDKGGDMIGSSIVGSGGDNWDNIISQAENYLRQIPGGDKLSETIPKARDIMELFQYRSPQARRLAEETMREVSDVLNRKVEEAKRLANEVAKEGSERARN